MLGREAGLRTGRTSAASTRGRVRVHRGSQGRTLILVSGFNVYPNEVEAVRRHTPPGSLESRRRGRSPTSTPAKSWRCSWWAARTRRLPKRTVHRLLPPINSRHTRCQGTWYFRAALPQRLIVGKILRKALREKNWPRSRVTQRDAAQRCFDAMYAVGMNTGLRTVPVLRPPLGGPVVRALDSSQSLTVLNSVRP